MDNYVSDGNNITIPAPKTVSSGTPVSFGGVVVVAIVDAVATVPSAFKTSGVIDLPKATGVSFSPGAEVFLVDADNNVSTSGDTYAGIAMETAGNPATSLRVWISGRGPQGPQGDPGDPG